MESLSQIVSGGYCIGCGVCAVIGADQITIELDHYGMYQPIFHREMITLETERALKVCPFSDEGPNEDDIALLLYPNEVKDERIGRYRELYAGSVNEGEFRARGSSGGIVSWIVTELLSTGLVDGVIHMTQTDDRSNDVLFSYSVSRTEEDVLSGAKSKYYPMELSKVLDQIRRTEGKYVLVGVPCFIKAVRRLMLVDPVIADRVKYCVGLVCGHLKSTAFADCIAWQAEIKPGKLENIDFRVKLPGKSASEYGITVVGDGKNTTRATREFLGANWGHGFFKYSACEFCDDVFAETADIAVGDAWLPEYLEDCEGNSIIITRSRELDRLIADGQASGRLSLKLCSPDKISDSQAGGLRHRRTGLSYRLFLKKEEGVFAPRKRVLATMAGIDSVQKKKFLLREILRQQSHELWALSVGEGAFIVFQAGMQKLIRKYNKTTVSFPTRAARKLIRIILKR